MVRFGLPAIAGFIRADFGLSLVQVGVLLAAFDLGALLTFLPTGAHTDRLGERRVMALGAAATGVGACLAGLAPGFLPLALLMAAAGVGFPSSQITGSHAVVGWFPAEERGTAMGIRQAGLPLGGLAGALLLPWLADASGWRAALVASGLAALAAAAVTWLVVPDGGGATPAWPDDAGVPAGAKAVGERISGSPSGASASGGPVAGGTGGLVRRFVGDPVLRATTVAACLLVVSQFSLTGYLPLYAVDRFGWALAPAARLLLLVHLGGVAGRLSWGWLSDRRFRGDRRQPLALAALAGAAAAVALAAAGGFRHLPPPAAGALAFAGGFTLLGWNGLALTAVAERAAAARAAMLAVLFTVLYVFTMLASPAFGWLVDRVGYPPAWLALVAVQVAAVWAVGRSRL